MKKLFLVISVITITLPLYSQINENYELQLNKALSKYNAKVYNSNTQKKEWAIQNNRKKNHVIQDSLLKENIAKAFNYVIFSSSDLVSNASAFGYSQNEKKTNISISTNLRLGKELSPFYARIGANATGSENIFEFYSDDSWNNNVSFNLGLILKIGKSSMFFKGDKEKFNHVNSKRRIKASKPIYMTYRYSYTTINKIKELKQDILTIKDVDKINTTYSKLLIEFPEIKKLIEIKNYEEAYSKLNSEEKNIQNYLDAFKSKNGLKKYIENKILYEFDKSNDITYGYSLKWFDLNLYLGNSTYKFSESNIDKSIYEEFSSIYNLSEDINKLKSVLSVNFNHSHNAEKTIWYYQLGASTSSGSFLENVLINGTPKIVQNENQDFIFQDEDNQRLGSFANIKKTLKTGAFNAYAAIFFTKKKNFGFNLSLSHNYLLDKPGGTFYNNNFTSLFGPIFRQQKEGETKLTFGIDLGWENAIYNTKVSDNFTGRIRVGIPFNIYSKK